MTLNAPGCIIKTINITASFWIRLGLNNITYFEMLDRLIANNIQVRD